MGLIPAGLIATIVCFTYEIDFLRRCLARLDEARLGPRYAAPLSRTRYSLARDQRRLLLVWTQGRETRALEIGPLTSSLNVAAVASGD